MDKTKSAFGYKRELGGGERIIFVSPMVEWFELIAVTIL